MYVPIRDIDQWIQFSESPPNDPILLYLLWCWLQATDWLIIARNVRA